MNYRNDIYYLAQSRINDLKGNILKTKSKCPITGEELAQSSHLDHDHRSGMVRGLISPLANLLLGKVENAMSFSTGEKNLPDILRKMADYLEKPKTNILHPKGCTQVVNRFKRSSKDTQEALIESLGIGIASDYKNSSERTKAYQDWLKKNKYK